MSGVDKGVTVLTLAYSGIELAKNGDGVCTTVCSTNDWSVRYKLLKYGMLWCQREIPATSTIGKGSWGQACNRAIRVSHGSSRGDRWKRMRADESLAAPPLKQTRGQGGKGTFDPAQLPKRMS
jgi:hypothetical protein